MIASERGSRPMFSCYWKMERSILTRYPISAENKANAPGRNFFVVVPGGLPSNAQAILVRLARIDRIMSSHREVDCKPEIYRAILRTRNAVHHALLSLPSWDNLPSEDASYTLHTPYELCRRAAILYSSAVILGLPHDLGWQSVQAHEIRLLIEAANVEYLVASARDLLIWVCSVGARAATDASDHCFFQSLLMSVLAKYGMQSIEALSINERFLWS